MGKQLVNVVLAVDKFVLLKIFNSVEPFGFSLGNVGSFAGDCLQKLDVALLGGSIAVVEVEQSVADSQTVAAGLVGVCRTDAFAGGANLGIAFEFLVSGIEQPVGGHNQMGFL